METGIGPFEAGLSGAFGMVDPALSPEYGKTCDVTGDSGLI